MLDKKKSSSDLVLKKRYFFNKVLFLHKAFHRDFWKGITSFSSRNVTKLITGQTCFALLIQLLL